MSNLLDNPLGFGTETTLATGQYQSVVTNIITTVTIQKENGEVEEKADLTMANYGVVKNDNNISLMKAYFKQEEGKTVDSAGYFGDDTSIENFNEIAANICADTDKTEVNEYFKGFILKTFPHIGVYGCIAYPVLFIFDESIEYKVNDEVLYKSPTDAEYQLYKFITEHKGAWDVNDVELISFDIHARFGRSRSGILFNQSIDKLGKEGAKNES